MEDRVSSNSSTDLRYRGTQAPKASPTTSTSIKFYDSIDKEKPVKKIKPRKLKELLIKDPVETEEVKLLFKLFLPKRKQFNDGSHSLKQLQANLPLLMPHSNDTTNISYPKLNFELHLFLASIMTNYVTSWYLTKLNTDNLEFLQNVYKVLCVFIKNLSTRCSIMLNSENLLSRIDEWSKLINDHIQELVGDKDDIKVIYDYESFESNTNVVIEPKNYHDIIDQYLISKHIIFESVEARDAYFQILVKKLLIIVFPDENGGGLNTEIGTNFVISIVGNLVLGNIVEKLSTTQFIFSTIQKVVDSIKSRLDSRTKDIKPQSIRARIKSLFSKSYVDLGYLMIWNDDGMDTNHNIFDNSIFNLFDTLSGFSQRKPMLATILDTLKNVIIINSVLATKINRIIKKTLFKGLVQSKLITDDSISGIISDLRQNIFNKSKTIKEDDKKLITIDSLTNDIHELITHKSLPISILNHFKYHNETEQDILDSIKSTLLIFDYESNASDHESKASDCEFNGLNQLLMIRIIDSMFANLYSELI